MFICAIQKITKIKKKILTKHESKFWKMLKLIKLVLAANKNRKNNQNLQVIHKLENHFTTYKLAGHCIT